MEISRPLRVLLVDDDAINHYIHTRIIKKFLTGGDIEIVSSSNCGAALEHLINLPNNGDTMPDFIFLAINTPVMEGWDFLDEYRKRNIDPMKECKIFLISPNTLNNGLVKARSNYVVSGLPSKSLAAPLFT